MPSDNTQYRVTRDVDGETAILELVPDAANGRVYVWLEPGLDPDAVVPFYRVTERGSEPEEHWQNFQEGDAIAPYAGERRALLGAIAELDPGAYTIDASMFTGLDTVKLPGIAIELEVVSESADAVDARAAFNAAFADVFQLFLAKADTEDAARRFQADFDASQAEFLVAAIVDLGAPHDHAETETSDMTGFFEFIEYLAALAHAGGPKVRERLQQQPDSPTHQHYIKYVKEYLAVERVLDGILEKYPYCR